MGHKQFENQCACHQKFVTTRMNQQLKCSFFFLLIRDEISLKKEEMRIDLWSRRNPPLELNGQLQTINPHL